MNLSDSKFRLILAILSSYRLARLISTDDGPGFIFLRLRFWAKDKEFLEREKNFINPDAPRWFGPWTSLAEGLSCPFCVGIWISLALFPLVIRPSRWGDLFLILLAISGGQAVLTGLEKR